VESDLAAAQGNYAGLKEEQLKSENAWGAADEAEKKAREDLERELSSSRSISDDVDCLKKALRENEDTILQSRKLIEDLHVEKTELACLCKRIERANTDLVGENTTLEEKICGELFYFLAFIFLLWCLFSID